MLDLVGRVRGVAFFTAKSRAEARGEPTDARVLHNKKPSEIPPGGLCL